MREFGTVYFFQSRGISEDWKK